MHLVWISLALTRPRRLRLLFHLDLIIDLSALLGLIAVHTCLRAKCPQVTATDSVAWLIGGVGSGFNSSASSLSRGSWCFVQK